MERMQLAGAPPTAPILGAPAPALVLGLVFVVACGPSSSDVAGRYQDVSESESATELILEPDGRARVEIRLWEPGSAAAVDVDTLVGEGSWSRDGTLVTVSYEGGSERLVLSESLSFEEFGCSGTGAALKGVDGTAGKGLLRGLTLWRAEALRSLPDPC